MLDGLKKQRKRGYKKPKPKFSAEKFGFVCSLVPTPSNRNPGPWGPFSASPFNWCGTVLTSVFLLTFIETNCGTLENI